MPTNPKKQKPLYGVNDRLRAFEENGYRATQSYRSEFRRDIDRLIHSTSFRRLQGKTQLFPGTESDFFRNRLTHSMEVAQIARTIACKLNEKHVELRDHPIDLDIVEFAGYAHDLGHPPFGHTGEAMLDYLMLKYGGFEGNAQTLRILFYLEKKGFALPDVVNQDLYAPREICGLNLCARTLASIIKYDKQIPLKRIDDGTTHALKAYYSFDNDLVSWIKQCVVGRRFKGEFKTLECQIMDLADDIAYSTYDLEDGLKAGFYSILDIVYAPLSLREKISQSLSEKKLIGKNKKPILIDENRVGEELQKLFLPYLAPQNVVNEVLKNQFQANISNPEHGVNAVGLMHTNNQVLLSQHYSKDGNARSYLTSSLVDTFINGVEFNYDKNFPSQSKVKFHPDTLVQVEVLKKFNFKSQIESNKMKISEIRGQEIVKIIFDYIKLNKGMLLPDDFKYMYDLYSDDNDEFMMNRVICDFVASMTDRYAIEFYGRLKSENPETIFKPI